MSTPILSSFQDTIINSSGQVLPGVTVIVLSGQADTVNTTTHPGSPLANIYSDPYGNNQINQSTTPLTTAAGDGSFMFWAQPGYYVVQAYGPGLSGQLVYGISLGSTNQVTFLNPSWINVKNFGAGSTASKAASNSVQITSGQFILTLNNGSGSQFASSDVGKTICVPGAGGSGGRNLYTTISSFQSATQVTLAASAAGTITNGDAFWWGGGQDDTTAIQNAINSSSIQGRSVYVPAGVYVISSPLVSVANLQGFFGDGSGQTFIIASSAAFTGAGLTVNPQGAVKVESFKLSNLRMIGPGWTTPTTITSWATSGSAATFQGTNNFVAGQTILIQGFLGTGTPFNNLFATVLSAGLSSSQFAIASSVSASSGTDVAVATQDWAGIAFPNSGTTANGPFNLIMEDLISDHWQGDAFKIVDVIVTRFVNCEGASCGGNAFGIYSDNGTAGISGTSCHFDTCYGNACYKAGYYAFVLVYSSFSNCACDSCGVAYYLEWCEAIHMAACGDEVLTYRNAAYPGHAFWMHGSFHVTIDDGRNRIASGNNAASVGLIIDSTTFGGVTSHGHDITVHSFQNTSSSGSTQPTNDLFIDTQCSNNVIDGYQFSISSGAWTNNGTGNRLWWAGEFQTNVHFGTGGVTNDGSETIAGNLTVNGNAITGTPEYTNSPLVLAANFAPSAAFGSTASISLVSGSNAAGNIQITAGGSGIAQTGVQVTFTYSVGDTFTINPVITLSRFDSNALIGYWRLISKTTTSAVFQFDIVSGTLASGNVLGVAWELSSKG